MKTVWIITYVLDNRLKTYASYDWTKADNYLRKVFEKGALVLDFKSYKVSDDVQGVK